MQDRVEPPPASSIPDPEEERPSADPPSAGPEGAGTPPRTGLARLIRSLFPKPGSPEPADMSEAPAPLEAHALAHGAALPVPEAASPASKAEPFAPEEATHGPPDEGGGSGASPRPPVAPAPAGRPSPRPTERPNSSSPEASPVRDRFTTRVARFLVAEGASREALAEGIRADAEALVEAGEIDRILDAASVLARGGAHDPAARPLAEGLLVPAVVRRITERLGTERDPGQRAPLLELVTRLPDPVVPALAEALSEARDRSVRRRLLAALGDLGDTGRQAGMTLLADPRWFAVRNGVILLAEIGDDLAGDAIGTVIEHPEARVRREAVLALARIGAPGAHALVASRLMDDDPAVRAAAAMGVGALGVAGARDSLLHRVEVEEDAEALVQCLRALGRLGGESAVPVLEKRATASLLSRPPRPVRVAAYQALAAIGSARARTLLLEGAEDRDPEVRRVVRDILRRLARPDPSRHRTPSDGGSAPG